MITDNAKYNNEKAFHKTYSQAYNIPRNIRAGQLKKDHFNLQVQMQGNVEEDVE